MGSYFFPPQFSVFTFLFFLLSFVDLVSVFFLPRYLIIFLPVFCNRFSNFLFSYVLVSYFCRFCFSFLSQLSVFRLLISTPVLCFPSWILYWSFGAFSSALKYRLPESPHKEASPWREMIFFAVNETVSWIMTRAMWGELVVAERGGMAVGESVTGGK